MDLFAGYSTWSQLSVVISVVAVCWSMVWHNLEHIRLQQFFARNFNRRARRLAAIVDPFLSVTFEEYEGGRIKSSDAYKEVRSYLTTATGVSGVRHLRAEAGGERDNAADKDRLVLSMAQGEEVADAFRGATVWWSAYSVQPSRDAIPWFRASRSERRFYRLEFHESDRELVLGSYLPHTFDKLAMDPAKKKEIIDDLNMFRKGKDYYNRIGKPWKRGYLLYGPPGTGKSTMVAAMANYLDYDVYDFELTSVKTNTELRKLLIETKSKSIMVFEDIDCSLDLTGKRKTKEEEDKEDEAEEEAKSGAGDPRQPKKDAKSKVTLSGLLNFIDGLWSACGEERLIVFTTNHVEKLDPALIRTGRMDKKIEMSYCDIESLRFLAKMHLDEDVEGHEMFGVAKGLLEEVDMVPVDVGEHLTRRSKDDDAGTCLARLVTALEKEK
ncbi:hypothetical protein HU200_035095 [Digitaria exilis]|uniref:AAA+ ATPase domain-containing protein n=1 Tax=Digitaria exilis TaxID=1010633 RepID=A0A835EJH0_9POAL|nr:hypothetical protein HU200_035095 [Digitaria exilis]